MNADTFNWSEASVLVTGGTGSFVIPTHSTMLMPLDGFLMILST